MRTYCYGWFMARLISVDGIPLWPGFSYRTYCLSAGYLDCFSVAAWFTCPVLHLCYTPGTLITSVFYCRVIFFFPRSLKTHVHDRPALSQILVQFNGILPDADCQLTLCTCMCVHARVCACFSRTASTAFLFILFFCHLAWRDCRTRRRTPESPSPSSGCSAWWGWWSCCHAEKGSGPCCGLSSNPSKWGENGSVETVWVDHPVYLEWNALVDLVFAGI